MSDIQLPEKKAAAWKIVVLCVASGVLNPAFSYLINTVAGLSLYLDTLFTAAVYFTAGLIPALAAALFLLPVIAFKYIFVIDLPIETALGMGLFAICSILEVLVFFAFRKKTAPLDRAFRKNPSLFNFINMAPLLLLITVVDCIVVSISGGIIDFSILTISVPKEYSPEDSFKLGLLRNNVPVLATAILSRIPINIVDRVFVIFGGYGVSLAYRKLLGKGKNEG
jgi:hypothetical protein